MRKLILIIALTMVPLGIWTAGCRNNAQQAAFPDTPEMKSLAKSAEGADAGELAAAPVIPAKPIDREILHYPDNGTLARVQAVRDRANQYASERAGHGLFALPEEQNYVATASPAPQGAASEQSAIMIPAPSAREFWSKPVAERGRAADRSLRDLPEDVSAMAGPARSGNDGNGRITPLAPTRAPARAARDTLILPPDDLPGVFMVDGLDEPLDSTPPPRGWVGMLGNDGGDALGAPPLSSRASAQPRSLDARRFSGAGARPRAEVMQRAPMVLDIDRLVGVDAGAPAAFPRIAPGARIVSSEGMADFEPLPEPIPLSQYTAMVMDELAAGVPGVSGRAPAEAKKADVLSAPVLPLPAALLRGTGESAPRSVSAAKKAVPAASAAAPAIPELTAAKTAAKIPGAAQFANVEKALEPLPVLAASASSMPTPTPVPAKPRVQDKVVVAMPAPMPEPLPSPEAAAAKAALLEFSPEAMDEAFAELNQGDFFRTDFWNPAVKTRRKADASSSSSFPALPELAEPGVSGELMIPLPPPPIEDEPRKVVLQPVRKGYGGAELEEIDSATEVPPLRF